DRLGLAELRHSDHLDAVRLRQQVDGTQQRHLARAEVGAEADVCAGHPRERSKITAAWSTGGSSTTSGLRTRTRALVTAGNCSTMPSATAPASLSRSRRSSPPNTSRTSDASRR